MRVRYCIFIQVLSYFTLPMSAAIFHPEDVHPSLWRASQLARGSMRTIDTGYAALSAELPGGGWPIGALVDLLVQQPGVGEIRLLRPALNALGKRPIALVQPPHLPNAPAFAYLGVPLELLIQVQAPKTGDALWAAEQILRAGTCGALLVWAAQTPAASLRRLHLAAQSSETLFVMMRPLAVAASASPALLRLAVRPHGDGISVEIVKRRGPVRAEPVSIPLQPSPILFSRHARISRRQTASTRAGSVSPEVVA
jgi:protein ImuA